MQSSNEVIEPVQTLRNTIYPPFLEQTKEKYGLIATDGSLAWIWSTKEIHCYNLSNYMRNYVITTKELEHQVR
jgi:hypothetical protein